MAESNTAYMKFINGKINSCSVVKSSSNFSGTLAALYRILYLKNNYCLYDSDQILYITKTPGLLKDVKAIYNKLKKEIEYNYITLFSFASEKVDFSGIDEIMEAYFKQYALKNACSIKLIESSEREKIVKASFDIVKQEYNGLKLLKDNYMGFFSDEIKWMKSHGHIELENYQNCDRGGRGYKKGEGPARLIRNSRDREAIYKLYTVYQDKLAENNFADYEDRDRLALKEAKMNRLKEYTHIFFDECRGLTKNQLELIGLLRSNKTYGEITYIYDNKAVLPIGAFLTKANKISELNVDSKVKNFYFKKAFESPYVSINDSVAVEKEREEGFVAEDETPQKPHASIESFKFVSLKYGKEFEFTRDITRKNEIIIVNEEEGQEIGAKEMEELPVFSDIAAGEPILMNPEMDDTFYLPQMWIKGRENHFILKVKGDSMIGADINDGDYVVVKSSQSAQNRDIVAVNIDGSATLKRLSIKRNSAVLMPENQKYKPIVIGDEGAQILGIAVGILKKYDIV